jgi:hypothetical protein
MPTEKANRPKSWRGHGQQRGCLVFDSVSLGIYARPDFPQWRANLDSRSGELPEHRPFGIALRLRFASDGKPHSVHNFAHIQSVFIKANESFMRG